MPKVERSKLSSQNFAYQIACLGTGLNMNGKKYDRIINYIVDEELSQSLGYANRFRPLV
jgi:hypothetical protein